MSAKKRLQRIKNLMTTLLSNKPGKHAWIISIQEIYEGYFLVAAHSS
jgi:hypothetical protein